MKKIFKTKKSIIVTILLLPLLGIIAFGIIRSIDYYQFHSAIDEVYKDSFNSKAISVNPQNAKLDRVDLLIMKIKNGEIKSLNKDTWAQIFLDEKKSLYGFDMYQIGQENIYIFNSSADFKLKEFYYINITDITQIEDNWIIRFKEFCGDWKNYNDTSNNNESDITEKQVKNICCVDGCNSSATKTYDSFITGKPEYYCSFHYDEIVNMMGKMEQDVTDTYDHLCEECSRAGTHSIIGFSGSTEYYCTEHYEELKALMNAMGLD